MSLDLLSDNDWTKVFKAKAFHITPTKEPVDSLGIGHPSILVTDAGCEELDKARQFIIPGLSDDVRCRLFEKLSWQIATALNDWNGHVS